MRFTVIVKASKDSEAGLLPSAQVLAEMGKFNGAYDRESPYRSSHGRSAMQQTQRIAPCLWFDNQAEEAATFYTAIFPNSRIVSVSRYGEAGREIHGRPAGSVMTVAFELDRQPFTALNGGPLFKFNEAISLQVFCAAQDEVDYYWKKLSAGGDERAQQCGWLKDKYGLSWQVVPNALIEMLSSPVSEKSQQVMQAVLRMKKIDIATLRRAYGGGAG